jgi:hypothetical protein
MSLLNPYSDQSTSLNVESGHEKRDQRWNSLEHAAIAKTHILPCRGKRLLPIVASDVYQGAGKIIDNLLNASEYIDPVLKKEVLAYSHYHS